MCSSVKNDAIMTSTEMSTCGTRKKQRKGADTDAAEYYSREIRLRLARCAADGAGAEGASAGGALHVAVRFVAAVLAAFLAGKEPTNKLGECAELEEEEHLVAASLLEDFERFECAELEDDARSVDEEVDKREVGFLV